MKPPSCFLRFALAGAALALGCGPALAEETLPMARQLLMAKAARAPAANIETRVIRVQFPPGFKSPVHTHDGPGPRYVLKGRVRVEDSGETRTYGPGDVFWETGGPMTIANVGGSDAEMVIFEMAPAP
jgi:quercetin dioxygenase-like cupin family protein